jgi:L-alanine-DL-glutamate epimerase-like enolase superfamily enzyme
MGIVGAYKEVGMHIQSMELFQVPPRWLFLKITTDDGLVGWGEPIVEGKAATVQAAVEEMSDFLIGREAGAIEDLWQVLLSWWASADERYLGDRAGAVGYQGQALRGADL